ncbi:MAG: YciI family protein [Mycobacterium sp.]|nr:YciI family protein [Mycobacterium sp.]
MFHVLNITYTQPLDVVDQSRPAHLEWLGDLVDKRRILLAGRLESQGGAVLIAADMSADEADALTATDPYVHAGVASYERVSFNAGFRAAGL